MNKKPEIILVSITEIINILKNKQKSINLGSNRILKLVITDLERKELRGLLK